MSATPNHARLALEQARIAVRELGHAGDVYDQAAAYGRAVAALDRVEVELGRVRDLVSARARRALKVSGDEKDPVL